MTSFSAVLTPTGTKATVAFFGAVDENTNLNTIDLKKYHDVELNLEQVTRISSRGMRIWMKWIDQLDKSKRYAIAHCPKVFILQANLVKNFIPKWIDIRSIEIPYFCEDCNLELSPKAPLEDRKLKSNVPAGTACPRCKNVATLDVQLDSYLGFLS